MNKKQQDILSRIDRLRDNLNIHGGSCPCDDCGGEVFGFDIWYEIDEDIEAFEQFINDPFSNDTVVIPDNEAQAALMFILGKRWLQENAPHRLKENSNEDSYDG